MKFSILTTFSYLKKIGFTIGLLAVSCKQKNNQLPILGNPTTINNKTVFPTINNFSLTNQDSLEITNTTFLNKVYVADFIFLSCPTICPKMTRAMYKTYVTFASDDRIAFISHTIDPKRDNVSRLKAYTNNLGIKSNKWHFVTGNQDSIIKLAEQSYYATAYPDSSAPGGFTHSGGLLLIDKNRHIRGVYDGTKNRETERLIADIRLLLKEQY